MFLPLVIDDEAEAQLKKVDDEPRKNLVNKCIQAIIVLGQNRQPIKKQDLNKLAFLSVTNYRISNAIIVKANIELEKVFGMRLFETECKTKFILVNTKVEYAEQALQPDELQKELSILYFILMDIFVSAEEYILEEDINNSLKPLNLTTDELKSYLDSFTKKLYLVQKRKDNTRSFGWGARAMAEVEPDNFFNRFLDLTGDRNDKNWPEQKRRIDNLKAFRSC